MKTLKLVSFFLAIIITTSCTIHKRQYSKGYFISWEKTFKKSHVISSVDSVSLVKKNTAKINNALLELNDTIIYVKTDLNNENRITFFDKPQFEKSKIIKLKRSYPSDKEITQNDLDEIKRQNNSSIVFMLLSTATQALGLIFVFGPLIILALIFLLISFASYFNARGSIKYFENKVPKSLIDRFNKLKKVSEEIKTFLSFTLLLMIFSSIIYLYLWALGNVASSIARIGIGI